MNEEQDPKTQLSPLKRNRPPPNIVNKYPWSHQTQKSDHIENEKEG